MEASGAPKSEVSSVARANNEPLSIEPVHIHQVTNNLAQSSIDAGAANSIRGANTAKDFSARSQSFPKQAHHSDQHNVSNAMKWRNKSVSCDALRSFEAMRKAHVDVSQSQDKVYFELFSQEIQQGRDSNARLVLFFNQKLLADLAYAESLRRLRMLIETPVNSSAATMPNSTAGVMVANELQATASCTKAMNSVGELQQIMSEKIVQFTNIIKRDVVTRPLEEMTQTYEEKAVTIFDEGTKLDSHLHSSLKKVQESFIAYDELFREMEKQKQLMPSKNAKSPAGNLNNLSSSKESRDLWLAEMTYGINVMQLKQARIDYVKGMSNLFVQYKNLEVFRVSVAQTALDTYLRKQKLIFDELAGSVTEPLAAAQKIDPERDMKLNIRRLPTNNTATALSSDTQEQRIFNSLSSPLASPLLVRCGFMKYQVVSSLFKTWKDIFCVITQDRFLHVFEMENKSPRPNDAILKAIKTSDDGVSCNTYCSIQLLNCKITITKGAQPAFEIAEAVASFGLFSVFKSESVKRHTFQPNSQTDLVDWVVAIKKLIPESQEV